MSQRRPEARVAVARPLYSQVRDLLLQRIRDSEWSTGQALPNEFNLAAEFGVSIGTVRRAVEGLEESGILVRKQGRGTYIAGPASTSVLGRFAPLRGPRGEPVALEYAVLGLNHRPAAEAERQELGLQEPAEVIEIVQRVSSGEGVRGVERSVVPAELFPRSLNDVGLTRHLYLAYAELGVFVTFAEDRIAAVAADESAASLLEVPLATPLLAIERATFAFERRPLELRSSLFALARASYHCAMGQESRA